MIVYIFCFHWSFCQVCKFQLNCLNLDNSIKIKYSLSNSSVICYFYLKNAPKIFMSRSFWCMVMYLSNTFVFAMNILFLYKKKKINFRNHLFPDEIYKLVRQRTHYRTFSYALMVQVSIFI